MNRRKSYLMMGGLVGLAALTALALFASNHQVSVADETSETVTTVFNVAGMTCGGCEAAVRTTVKRLDGVKRVEASRKEGKALVTYDPVKVSVSEIEAAIEKLGYQAESRDLQEGKE